MTTTTILSRYSVPNFKQIYQPVIQLNKQEGSMCGWSRVSEKTHTHFV